MELHPTRSPGPWRGPAAAALVTLLLVAGCGGGGSEADEDDLTITIAEQAIADFAPVWIGVSEGFFEEVGLTVEIVPGAASSAGQIPLVLSGRADLAATTATSALQSNAESIPVHIVGGLTTFGTNAGEDQAGVIAPADSAIRSYADLEGTVVAVSGLRSVTHALMLAAIEQSGGDPGTVQFIQAPMPNIANLVATGGADAGFVVDPFLSTALAEGMTLVGRPAHEVAPGFPATSLVAASSYVASHQEALTRFHQALARAAEHAAANPELVVNVVAEQVGVPVEALAGTTNPVFNATVEVSDLEAEAEMLLRHGALTDPVDVAAIVWSPAGDG